jgi:molybdate transport system substrate-binding protein
MHRFNPIWLALSAVLLAALAICLPACSSKPAASSHPIVLVSAAASTKEIMEAAGKQFTVETGTEVKFNFGPSSGLASQIAAGAPAELFLSANRQWADDVQTKGLADVSTALLTNRLVIVVPKDNPAKIHTPADLLSPNVKKIALAGETVPAGIYAKQSLTKLQLWDQLTGDNKIVRGEDVRTALAYVERGEAEAGIVYSTDAGIASGVAVAYEFDPSLHDEIVYMLVLLKHGAEQPEVRKLYEFLQSPAADKIYTQYGFSRAKP